MIDDYMVERELARGGMGVVSIARHRRFGRRVALKRMLGGSGEGSAQARARFVREGQALGRLQHPNVVRVFEVGETVEGPWLAMELVEGESLEGRLERGVLEEREAVELVVELARGLEHAHGRGILHRDLKPDNVLISREGVPKLTDFGLAKLEEGERLTQTGESMGTPGYMAPEQAAGEAMDARTDVYGLGAVLYAVLAGRAPFEGESAVQLITAVLSREPDALESSREGVSRDLATVVHKALAMEPERRYSSVAGLREDLERWLRGEPVVGRRPTRRERLGLWVQRNRGLAKVGVLGVVGVVLVGVLGGLSALRARAVAETSVRWVGVPTLVEVAGSSRWVVSGVVEGESVEGLEVAARVDGRSLSGTRLRWEGGPTFEVELKGLGRAAVVELEVEAELAWGGSAGPWVREVALDLNAPTGSVEGLSAESVEEEGVRVVVRASEPGCGLWFGGVERAQLEGTEWEGVLRWEWLTVGQIEQVGELRDPSGNVGELRFSLLVVEESSPSRLVWDAPRDSPRGLIVLRGVPGATLEAAMWVSSGEVDIVGVGDVALGGSRWSGLEIGTQRPVRVRGVRFRMLSEARTEVPCVRVVRGRVTFDGCTFESTLRKLGGVGVQAVGGCEVTMRDCAFDLVLASGVWLQPGEEVGGERRFEGAGTLRMERCRLRGEISAMAVTASLSKGWLSRPTAVRVLGGTLEMQDVTIEEFGGLGVYAVSSDVTMERCRLEHLHERALFVDRRGWEESVRVRVSDCDFVDNLRTGVYVDQMNDARFERCRITGNGMGDPRATFYKDSAVIVCGLQGSLVFEDCEIWGNAASGLGLVDWLSETEREVAAGWSEEELEAKGWGGSEWVEAFRRGRVALIWEEGAAVELRGCRLGDNCAKGRVRQWDIAEVWADRTADFTREAFSELAWPRVVLDAACEVSPKVPEWAFGPPLEQGFFVWSR